MDLMDLKHVEMFLRHCCKLYSEHLLKQKQKQELLLIGPTILARWGKHFRSHSKGVLNDCS
jgi:hypothetical protein